MSDFEEYTPRISVVIWGVVAMIMMINSLFSEFYYSYYLYYFPVSMTIFLIICVIIVGTIFGVIGAKLAYKISHFLGDNVFTQYDALLSKLVGVVCGAVLAHFLVTLVSYPLSNEVRSDFLLTCIKVNKIHYKNCACIYNKISETHSNEDLISLLKSPESSRKYMEFLKEKNKICLPY